MKAIEILCGALIEIARENIELDQKRNNDRETATYWYKQYETQNTERGELSLALKDTQAKLEAATKTVANLEEYIKLLEKGVQGNKTASEKAAKPQGGTPNA